MAAVGVGLDLHDGLALTSPERQGLFLAQEWLLDDEGNFTEPVPDSRGILIPTADDVRWVRILASAAEPKGSANG